MFEGKVERMGAARHKSAPFWLVVLPLVVFAIGLAAQSATYLNHDVSWVLYSSALMLRGAVFGRDVIAANPPLIWWLSIPSNAIAQLLGASPIGIFRLLVAALIGASLLMSERLLAAQRISMGNRALFLTFAAYLFTFGASRDFGQREQLAAILVLPYVLAAAGHHEGGRLPRLTAFGIGIAAGIGVAFKPYFLLVPILVELALQWRRRSPRLAFRPEVGGAAAAIAAYVIATLLFARPWLIDAVPGIERVYWAFEQPNNSKLIDVCFQFLLPLIAFGIVACSKPKPQSVYLGLAAGGFFLAAVWQAKYYSYHLYPTYTMLVLAVAVGIPRRLPLRAVSAGLIGLIFVLDLPASAQALLDRTDRGASGREINAMVGFVDRHVPRGGSFLAISTHPFPGFPTALYAHRRWASVSNSRIFLPAVVRLRERGESADSGLLRFAESKEHEAMLRDLANEPDIVIIDNRRYRHAIGSSRFNFLAFYLEDERFRKQWSAYAPLQGAPAGFAAYVRIGGPAS